MTSTTPPNRKTEPVIALDTKGRVPFWVALLLAGGVSGAGAGLTTDRIGAERIEHLSDKLADVERKVDVLAARYEATERRLTQLESR